MLEKLKEKKTKAIERMRELLNLMDTEQRDLTEAEDAEYKSLEDSIEKLDEQIRRAEDLAIHEADIARPKRVIPMHRGKVQDPKEWRGLGDFLYAVRFNPHDRRLQDCDYREASEELRTETLVMGTGVYGGFAVPTQFREQLLQITPETAKIRSRAQVIPAGDPPDAEVSMPALDQSTTTNMYGGVTVTWIGEGATKPQTDLKLREVTLKPNEVAAHVIVSDKLLRNWQAAGPTIGTMLRGAIISAEEIAFISGSGVAKPKGFLNSAACKVVNRTTASQIAKADVDSMYMKILEDGGSYVWLASPTVKGQLMALADAGNNNVWMGNYAAKEPASMLGYPIVWSGRNPALGTKGDLCLVNLNYYLIKDGSGPYVSASEHVYFTSNKTVIKAFWLVDGDTWLTTPLPLEGSTSDTVSPFVVLN